MPTMIVSAKKILKQILPDFMVVRILNLLNYISRNKLPSQVRIEASTLCQLNCKTCYMRRDNSGTVGSGYLKFVDFCNFIRKNKYVKYVELSNSGEIFLNPDLARMMKFAFENDITLSADSGVNFNTVSDDMLEALVKYRFQSMTISIDGASQEVYSRYRINGDYDKVIANIKKLNAVKEKYNSELPRLKWQYILMEHNEHEVAAAKRMAEELKMGIKFKRPWDPGYIPRNAKNLREETGLKYLSREEQESEEGRPYMRFVCYRLWETPQINWDGRLLGCCLVYKNDFGVNVFETGLKKAIRSKNYKYAKKMLLGKVTPSPQKDTQNIPCASCSVYREICKTKAYIR